MVRRHWTWRKSAEKSRSPASEKGALVSRRWSGMERGGEGGAALRRPAILLGDLPTTTVGIDLSVMRPESNPDGCGRSCLPQRLGGALCIDGLAEPALQRPQVDAGLDLRLVFHAERETATRQHPAQP